VQLSMFPSAPTLRSTHSAGRYAPLFAGFFATMARSDFSSPYIVGYGFSRLPDAGRRAVLRPMVRLEISRFPCKERAHMPGSSTPPGRRGARVWRAVRVAFRDRKGVGTRDDVTFVAQWLAYAYLCQRFVEHLAVSYA
jgi:hypothetical protein